MTVAAIKKITDRHPIKILVHGLDDDELVVQKTSEQLRLNNINFEIFGDQNDFLAHLQDNPHICFIDYRLPGPLNGLEITKIATDADETRPKTRLVIMVSGIKGKEYEDALWKFHNQCGGWRWVRKGDDYSFTHDLLIVIQEAIEIIKTRLEWQGLIDELKDEASIRKRRKSLTNDTVADI